MWINRLLNIKQFIAVFLLGLTSCTVPVKNALFEYQPLPDTLFTPFSLAHKYGKIPAQKPLADSLTNIYILNAQEGTRFTSLDSSGTFYKAYNEGVYQLESNTYGKIVRFEPSSNAYYSLQLYIVDNKENILDAIELAYLFGEEGANGVGAAYLIKEKDQTNIFVKQDWVNYLGEDAEFSEKIDTIIAYKIGSQQKESFLIDSNTEKHFRTLFLN